MGLRGWAAIRGGELTDSLGNALQAGRSLVEAWPHAFFSSIGLTAMALK